jgi:type II secretory pathway component PulM
MRQWFEQFTPREQLYLLAAAAAVTLYILLMMVWRPVAELRDDMAQRNEDTTVLLGRVRAMAGELQQLQSSSTAPRDRNMAQLINSSTSELGVRPSRIQPNSRGETQIRFEDVEFTRLMRWLHRMESVEGIPVREVAINQGERGGVVKATVRLGASS